MVTAAEPIGATNLESSQLISPGVNSANTVCGSSYRKGRFNCWFVCWRNQAKSSAEMNCASRLWPDGTFVDFDHNISSAINKLRAVLNDSANTPRFIETVGSRGYRFLADVKRISSDPAPSSQPPKQETPKVPMIAGTIASPRKGGVEVSCRNNADFVFPRVRLLPMGPQDIEKYCSGPLMVAVLPFQNLTGDPAQDYFSDGLTEEMIAELTRLNQEHLGVIARTSVMLYKQSPKPLDQIGRELGVQYVMEGSVRRDSSRLRITAELIQVKDQTHLWAREYDRELNNSLALQSEIAQEIGDEIRISLVTATA